MFLEHAVVICMLYICCYIYECVVNVCVNEGKFEDLGCPLHFIKIVFIMQANL